MNNTFEVDVPIADCHSVWNRMATTLQELVPATCHTTYADCFVACTQSQAASCSGKCGLRVACQLGQICVLYAYASQTCRLTVHATGHLWVHQIAASLSVTLLCDGCGRYSCSPNRYVFPSHWCPVHDLILSYCLTLIVSTAARTCASRKLCQLSEAYLLRR